ncbi:hypothetical protein ACFL2H_06830 [Planctomycetota bacterium]
MTDKHLLFSTNWLNGEPIPDDVRILLANRDKLASMTECRFVDCIPEDDNWALYSGKEGMNNPGVRATLDTCQFIVFILGSEEFSYGYWLGPEKRAISESPIVRVDTEASFTNFDRPTIAGALLENAWLLCPGGDEEFLASEDDLREWFHKLGIFSDDRKQFGGISAEEYCDQRVAHYLNAESDEQE